ncbi:polyprenyl synthetase family protein [Myroides marinus]|uniref:Geranylgeranyl diphosphate synthase, type II n=1 Tax=Myroides marinus TaxID=703342 RepID=A0A1H6T8Z6_9FLAO|nr:polyprenyl synthetase family protein [Myroides marinus]MDM1378782.1 polyprenyl synthetase family protein [Myroides marinus]MDM1386053.1 polyprenyl synthetase family protein [Myroides marinus]MDM1393169.1 polyprenyl synthetase family protein [Myroides marinus]SEI76573.1 geranylgeranyl diphosphate synthase, type II [Myroides marinus]
MQSIVKYKEQISEFIDSISLSGTPKELYEPISYILSLGGKQIRPVLTLMAADVFGIDPKRAIHAATAIELFHNFSLMHDDIMDDAPLRRGHQTVHEKWNTNTAILSGDAMLILAYQYFENYENNTFRDLAKLFSKTAIEVCEGQQWDICFENRNDVSIPEYIKMIKFKTAVLVGAALKMGAIVAETSEKNAEDIYDFGINLGIAFQLQDDYLDAFGDAATFGKQVGGDILENKKTFLYLKGVMNANDAQRAELVNYFSTTDQNEEEKVKRVKELFVETGSAAESTDLIEEYTLKALAILDQMDIPEEKKEQLRTFSHELMRRRV